MDMSIRFGGFTFYDYHKAFSARAASLLLDHHIKIDWSYRDQNLFNQFLAGHKINACQICNNASHSAGFCPQSLHGSKTRTRPNPSPAQEPWSPGPLLPVNLTTPTNQSVPVELQMTQGCAMPTDAPGSTCPVSESCAITSTARVASIWLVPALTSTIAPPVGRRVTHRPGAPKPLQPHYLQPVPVPPPLMHSRRPGPEPHWPHDPRWQPALPRFISDNLKPLSILQHSIFPTTALHL